MLVSSELVSLAALLVLALCLGLVLLVGVIWVLIRAFTRRYRPRRTRY